MSARPELSIIIPSYNCADLVGRAVESAYAFSEHSTEVIVIDDGSTDDTTQVLAELLQRFPELRVLRKANGGLSSARNHGMDHASGRYVLFLDADDELIAVETLPQIDGSAEMVRLGVEEVTIGGGVAHHVETAQAASGIELLSIAFARQSFYTPSWAYIYHLEWLRSQDLRFVHGLIHEDMLFTVEALLRCRVFAATPTLAYRYFRRPDSITTAIDDSRIIKRTESLAKITHHLTAYANIYAEADIGWWVLNSIDYATSLARQSTRRMARWKVMEMEIRFFICYRQWGVYRKRRDVRYRIRQRLEWCLA